MTAPLPVDSPTGSIYDLGYRGYTGPRLGRGFAIRSLFTHSLRTTYGLGRTTRAKLAPWFLLVFAVLPSISIIAALVLVARFGGQVSEIVGANSPIRYDTMFSVLTGAAIISLFCAAQAPELFGRDQRHGILSLYFARALRRTDYTLARILGFVGGVADPLPAAPARAVPRPRPARLRRRRARSGPTCRRCRRSSPRGSSWPCSTAACR